MNDFLAKQKVELDAKGLIYLKIKILPKADCTEFRELVADETLKIAVKAPPLEGKANALLEKFLKQFFGAQEVKILTGQKDRVKLVKIVLHKKV